MEGSQLCPECGENVPVKKMKQHNRRRHDTREYQCEQCGITTVGYEKHQTHKVCELSYFVPTVSMCEQDSNPVLAHL